ncbi:MAG: D-lyxose/D-mannose family sugar isomerase [Hyphomicrobiales bacterium]|nr:MAG: D-lyxose/D-mannose family sugar isomerase [Hyphomicrobiales bacterium]
MKRSRVNAIVEGAEEFVASLGFRLPPFAYWTPEYMQAHRGEIGSIIDAELGWDITDYGQGRFDELGLVLFTIRNGDARDLARGQGRLYAEKIMISRLGQLAPMHRHGLKAEDIINRGGGVLALKLYASSPDGVIDREAEVTVPVDGLTRRLPPGGILRLEPGESVSLLPGVWHAFWAEGADTLIGEVSTVNDDHADNVFVEPLARFSELIEDCPPRRLLVSDYPGWLA